MNEQSETIQRPDGRWINVYGRSLPKRGQQLPGTEHYGSVEEAVAAAKARSKGHVETASPPAPGLEQVQGALSPWNQMTQPLRQGHEALTGALSDLKQSTMPGPREGSAQAWGALGGPDTQLQALLANAAADVRNPSKGYRQREMLKLVQQDPIVAFLRGASFDPSALPEFYRYFVTRPQMEEQRRKVVEDWQRREQWKLNDSMQQQHMQPGPGGSTYFGRGKAR